MTREERQTLEIVVKMIEQLERYTRGQFGQLDRRMQSLEGEVAQMADRCEHRKEECAELLEARKLMFEEEIRAGDQAAILAATEPSVYWKATSGASGFILKVVAALGAAAGLAVAIGHLVGWI